MSGHIYALIFASGKGYIGQTRQDPLRRFWGHRCTAKNSKRGSRVYRAWRKYGEPKLILLGEFPAQSLDAKEAEFIATFGTLSPLGYNLEKGGNDGFSHPETRAKISAAGKGRKHSPETLAKIGAASRIRMSTPEARAKLAERNRAMVWTPELRAKVGAKSVGRVRSLESRQRAGETIKATRSVKFWSSRRAA
jgi:hypothetical protein